MKIACLGWGSLIWDPGALPVSSEWYGDGPDLSVEFARQSSNGRITLVVTEGVQSIPVLWTDLRADAPDHARMLLAEREGVSKKNASRLIGLWSSTDRSSWSNAPAIGDWATTRRLDAVVWTALGPKFSGENRIPSRTEVVDYLRSLEGKKRSLAENYIRKTPSQIRTQYRQAIEEALGWHPIAI
ncbi:MAG: hypothetical protein R3D51_17225 [Hyphomicrobiaceae bacterium]